MDHDADLALVQPHRLRRFLVEDLVDDLDLHEVIARAQRAALVGAATERMVADEVGPRAVEEAVRFGVFDIAVRRQPPPLQPAHAGAHQLPQFFGAEPVLSAAADAGRHVAEEFLHERLELRLDVVVVQVRADQADTAIDVVADATRGDDAAFFGVGRTHAADREPVAPVDVGHGQTGDLDAGERGHVGHLFGGLIAADQVDQFPAGVNQAVDAHGRLVGFRNPPAVVVDAFERSVVGLFGHGGLRW